MGLDILLTKKMSSLSEEIIVIWRTFESNPSCVGFERHQPIDNAILKGFLHGHFIEVDGDELIPNIYKLHPIDVSRKWVILYNPNTPPTLPNPWCSFVKPTYGTAILAQSFRGKVVSFPLKDYSTLRFLFSQ